MILIRPSVPEDVPRQRELWALAFGDSGPYVDNFYENYYRPHRVLVLEEDGRVQAMTAWFDTEFVLPGGERYRAGYLYAVATHPDCRGRGFAGRLLAYADGYLKEQGCQAVTTVPAQPSLHRFFGANGFRECFTHSQYHQTVFRQDALPAPEPLSPEEYGRRRELLLAHLPHIAYPADALAYQAGCCRISGGGLYALSLPGGPALLCAEGMEDGTLLVKELLTGENAPDQAAKSLKTALPAFGGWYRTIGKMTKFGMLKWLDRELEENWDWSETAYMGLGFD